MFQGLTNKGKEYMAKCLAENKPVLFTKAKIGDGNIALEENPEDFIEIKSLKKEVNITEKVQNKDAVKLTIQFENTGILDGYFLREIGIYVEDEGQEILYWYINDGSESSWLPPAAKSPVNFKFFINLMATNLESIIVNWTGKELWVDKEFLNKELDKIENEIKGIDEKFKNFCPYAVGDIYITTNSSNPSTKFLGTTWSKIEGRFLLGTSSSQASKLTGGSMNKNISQVNLPNVKLTVDSFSLSTTSHYHLIAYNQNNYGALTANNYISNAAHIGDHQSYEFKGSINIPNVGKTKDAGGGNTSTASPQTSALGSGQALDITPSYYTAHMWLRTS